MQIARIDARCIVSWETFHDVFADVFDFPDYYGRNMNAWIDCMSDLEPVVIQIDHIDSLQAEIYTALVDCAAFVNWRYTDAGAPAILTLSYYRTER
jgi:RNAse (barnase) inhibitor barstar